MSETPNAYRECAREGCEEPVAHGDPREKHRGMQLGGDEYCSLTCRMDAMDDEEVEGR
jgi:hypothetical protein